MRLHDRKAVLPAKLVGGLAQRSIVALLRAVVLVAIQKRYGVENDVVVDMLLVQMCADYGFKTVKTTLDQLYADPVRQFGCDLPRFEALYDVKALNAFCLAPTFLGGAHFRPCAFHAFQVKRSLEQAGRPFFGVERICDVCRHGRILALFVRIGGFDRVGNIPHGLRHARMADGANPYDGHYTNRFAVMSNS